MSGPTRSTPGDRADRLAQALRDNLRRRKAQARAMGPTGDAQGEGDIGTTTDRAQGDVRSED